MGKDQINTLTRLAEDIGYVTACLESLKTDHKCSQEMFNNALERMKHSHVAILEVFIGVDA